MDVAGLVVGSVGVALALIAMVREGSTRSKLRILQRSVETERDLRDLDEALVALNDAGQLVPATGTGANLSGALQQFDRSWNRASGRALGHLDAAEKIVPRQALRGLQRSLSKLATHLALLRDAEYEASGLGELHGAVMDVLQAVAVVQAQLKRRSTT